jgi:hypothetical protein
VERPVVGLPGGHGVLLVHPGGLEDGLPEPLHRLLLREAGEDGFGPARMGEGDDGPVGDELGDGGEGGPVGPALGLLGPAHPLRGKALQGLGVVAAHRQAGRALVKGLGHALVQPGGGLVQVGLRHQGQALPCDEVVPIKNGEEACPVLVGLFRQEAHEVHRLYGGGGHDLLALFQVEPNPDGQLGQLVEVFREGVHAPKSWSPGGFRQGRGQDLGLPRRRARPERRRKRGRASSKKRARRRKTRARR